jgi:hypothetical protein
MTFREFLQNEGFFDTIKYQWDRLSAKPDVDQKGLAIDDFSKAYLKAKPDMDHGAHRMVQAGVSGSQSMQQSWKNVGGKLSLVQNWAKQQKIPVRNVLPLPNNVFNKAFNDLYGKNAGSQQQDQQDDQQDQSKTYSVTPMPPQGTS